MKNLKKKVILTSCVFTMIFSVSASISAAQDSTQNLPSKSIVPYDVPVGYGAMGWDWPTTGETISDGWGWTGSRFHKGIDIAVYKQNVYAAADGEVLGSGVYSDSVQYVTIKHDQNAIEPGNTHNKLVSRYLHLVKGSQKVKKGDRVNQGQTIGTSGNSGASDPGKDNNYHLHFDINNKSAEFPSNNDTIDPMLFYPYNFTLKNNHFENHVENNDVYYYDEEHSFDLLMIEYVGEEKFEEWFESIEEKERTRTAFKEYFNISGEKMNEILGTTK